MHRAVRPEPANCSGPAWGACAGVPCLLSEIYRHAVRTERSSFRSCSDCVLGCFASPPAVVCTLLQESVKRTCQSLVILAQPRATASPASVRATGRMISNKFRDCCELSKESPLRDKPLPRPAGKLDLGPIWIDRSAICLQPSQELHLLSSVSRQ